jgi:hypothetical protein
LGKVVFFRGGGGCGVKILVAENEEKTSSQKAYREQFGACLFVAVFV